MTDHVLMKCGHSANATHEGKPCCAICGLAGNDDWKTPAEEEPDLTGRKARCSYYRQCKNEEDSNLDLAFFEHRPDEEYDRYYCGCHGWN